MENPAPGSPHVSRSTVVAALVALLAVASALATLAPGDEPRGAERPAANASAAWSAARTVRAAAPIAVTAGASARADRPGGSPARDAAPDESTSDGPAVADARDPRDAAVLLVDAREARRRGDLRAQLVLLEAAVERAPGVETRAALGTLYLELGAVRRAEANLRSAAEGDPGNADHWLALANALTLKPDPVAAAEALARARAAAPGARIARDAGGRLVLEPAP